MLNGRRIAAVEAPRPCDGGQPLQGRGKARRASDTWNDHVATMKALSDERKSTRFIEATMKEHGLAISQNARSRPTALGDFCEAALAGDRPRALRLRDSSLLQLPLNPTKRAAEALERQKWDAEEKAREEAKQAAELEGARLRRVEYLAKLWQRRETMLGFVAAVKEGMKDAPNRVG